MHGKGLQRECQLSKQMINAKSTSATGHHLQDSTKEVFHYHLRLPEPKHSNRHNRKFIQIRDLNPTSPQITHHKSSESHDPSHNKLAWSSHPRWVALRLQHSSGLQVTSRKAQFSCAQKMSEAFSVQLLERLAGLLFGSTWFTNLVSPCHSLWTSLKSLRKVPTATTSVRASTYYHQALPPTVLECCRPSKMG